VSPRLSANNNNPVFVKLIRMTYKFEEQQPLVVKLFDIDSTMHRQSDMVPLDRQDFIGEMECQLAQVMGSRGCSYSSGIKNRTHPERARTGTVTIRGEEIKNANGKFVFQLAGEKLDNKVRSRDHLKGIRVWMDFVGGVCVRAGHLRKVGSVPPHFSS
jgi:hypothetical protein